jgi:DNA-binding CsgD family transcriptional regulator
MRNAAQPVRIISYLLIVLGITLLTLKFVLADSMNIALPLVFLVLGGGYFVLVFTFQPRWRWSSLLYVPGCLLIALGLILLINAITGEHRSWAYAWLLLTASTGIGMIIADRQQALHRLVRPIGWAVTAVSVTFFVVAGAIAGGLFIQIMAPILLVVAGLLLRLLHVDVIFSEFLLRRRQGKSSILLGTGNPLSHGSMVEPLSERELEVLNLIAEGNSNRQIASQLHIAPSTVKTHINNIYGKLEVQTRVQAINRARELNLFES